MSTNILINSRSMNGIITISDGTATLENGDLVCDDVSCDDVNSSNIITNNITTNILTCQGSFRSNIIGQYTIPILTSSEYGSLISYGNTSGNGATDFTNFQSTYTSTKGGFNFWNKSTTQTLTNLGIIDNTQTYFKSQLIGCTAETPLNNTSIVNKSYVDNNFIDFTTDQTISASNKRFNGLFCTSLNITPTVGGLGNRQQIYISGTTLEIVALFNNNIYSFYTRDGASTQTNPVRINSASTTITNYLITNNLTADNNTGTQNIYTTNTTGIINIGTGQTTGTINIGTGTSNTNIKSILKIYDKSSPYTNTLEINQTAANANYTTFAGTTTASVHNFHAFNNANLPKKALSISFSTVQVEDGLLFNCRQIRSTATSNGFHEFFKNMTTGTLTMGSLTSNIINDSKNTLNAQHTFNNSTPICSVATPTANDHLTRKDYIDNNFMFKTGNVADSINGIKTFTNRVNFNGSPSLVAANLSQFNGNTEFTGTNGYFQINCGLGNGTYNPSSTPGTIGIIGLKDQINDKVLFTLYGTTHVSVKLSFTEVSMGFGGGASPNTSVTCDGTNVIIKPNIKFSGDNTIQNSAFTGAGSLSGTYNLSNITIDTNGKITSLSSGLSSANVWTSTNSFNSFLPTSTATPSNPSDLTTKAYVDGMPVHGILNSNNTFSGVNTFTNNVNCASSLTFTDIGSFSTIQQNSATLNIENPSLGSTIRLKTRPSVGAVQNSLTLNTTSCDILSPTLNLTGTSPTSILAPNNLNGTINLFNNLTSGGTLNIGSSAGVNIINGDTTISNTLSVTGVSTFSDIITCDNGATFNNIIPTTSISATNGDELVNYTTLTSQGFVTSSSILSANNNFTGFNTFTNGLTVRNTLLLKDVTNTLQGSIDVLSGGLLTIGCSVYSGKIILSTQDSVGNSYNRLFVDENEVNITAPLTLFVDYTYYNPANFNSTRLGYSMSNTGGTNVLTNNTANNSGQLNIPAGSWNITYTGTITVITGTLTTLTSLEIYVADSFNNDFNIIGINVLNYYQLSTVPINKKIKISGSGNYISYSNATTELNLRLLPLFTAGLGGLNFQGKISATRNA